MKPFRLVLFLFMIVSLCGLESLFAQYGRPQSRAQKIDFFQAVNPGQWVKVEGTPQPDLKVLTRKAKILSGDFEDDDWEISGKVTSINKKDSTFRILNLLIRVNHETDFETDDFKHKFSSFSQMKPGMVVEVEGTFLKNGTLMADEVQDETYTDDEKKLKEVAVVGRVQSLDPRRGLVRVMGIEFQITPQTVVKSAFK
ncbi:MAG: hypothetical protein D6715_01010 [Calditrichaeota bacterium]|nr:MAG: hypothetical protein D6715_01010 [Calditrichota bacterium]